MRPRRPLALLALLASVAPLAPVANQPDRLEWFRDQGFGMFIRNLDFSLFKDSAVTERCRLQLRWESSNLANHLAFRFSNSIQGDSERHMQFALRFLF